MDNLILQITGYSAIVEGLAAEELVQVAAAIFGYVVVANVVLRPHYTFELKAAFFAIVNLTSVFLFFFQDSRFFVLSYDQDLMIQFASYVTFCALHWLLIRILGRWPSSRLAFWAALIYPLAPLVVIKYQNTWFLVGVSYMAFRMAQAVLEVQRSRVAGPGFSAYIAFLFFPLTISIGPISPYAYFTQGLERLNVPDLISVGRAIARILLGYIMLKLFATVSFQMSFGAFWQDGFDHGISDFLIASFATLAHLYFNFAGFTHIVIGSAALIGMPVKENFNSPLLSLSIKDFWNRWHITLSEFVRDLVYTPVAVGLTRKMGVAYVLPISIFAAVLTFVIIGLWHEISLGFFLFGLMHGIGFAANSVFEHYKRKYRVRSLNGGAWVFFSWLLTTTYISLSMFFIEFTTSEKIEAALGLLQPRW